VDNETHRRPGWGKIRFVRPALHPALSRSWRDESTLQIGSTPDVAVVLGGLGPLETRLLSAMDGQHDLSALRQLAVELGGEPASAERLVELLTSSGVVIDCSSDHRPGRMPTREPDQSVREPDRSSVALQHASLDGGDAALASRSRMRVDVHGAGRVGAQVARLLAAAGVGEVVVHDRTLVSASDVCPGGFGPDAVGRQRADELHRLIHADGANLASPFAEAATTAPSAARAEAGRTGAVNTSRTGPIDPSPATSVDPSPATSVNPSRTGPVNPSRTGPVNPNHAAPVDADRAAPVNPSRAAPVNPNPAVPSPGDPNFAVLAPTGSTGRDEAAEFLRHGIPHLFVQVTELTGVVGPLVVPGESSCLRCHDLHRADRDRHWPLLLDTSVRRPPAAPACDASLAATVAGLASAQVLAHLDGFAPAAVDGTIEVTLPHGLPRRRSWRRHPGCGCDWDRDDETAEWDL
jgi:hypothetical protein